MGGEEEQCGARDKREGRFYLFPTRPADRSAKNLVDHKSVWRILIVCHANTSRSIMAHALLGKMLAERKVEHIDIRSGGIALYARDGMLPSLDARLVLRDIDIELRENDIVSTDLKRHGHLIAQADLILTMTHEQKQMLAAHPETAGKRVFTLKEFAGEDGDIDDPAMQGEEAFRARLDEIKRCLEKSFEDLLELSHERL